MGTTHGNKITTDGLMLHVDCSNPKSFRGESTTNYVVATTWSSGDAGWAVSTVTNPALKYDNRDTYLCTPGATRNGYLYEVDLAGITNATVWTFSAYVRREDRAAISSLSVYVYYNGDDGAPGTIEDCGNGWYRIYRTKTGPSGAPWLVGFYEFGAGRYYLSGAMLEKKSYPTQPVATGGSRTGVLKDLVRGIDGTITNATAAAENKYLTFANNNAFVDFGTSLNGTYTAFTILAWIYPATYVSGDYRAVWQGTNTADAAIYLYTSHRHLYLYPNTVSTVPIADNTWTHIGVACSAADIHYFVNGTLEDMGVAATYALTLDYFHISGASAADTEDFDGRIATMQFYNRMLTTAEVQQNYNASKARFGL